MHNLKRLRSSRYVKNASWIVFGKIVKAVLGIVVGVFTARYLGPSNYGLINYATAFTAFFTSICALGINGVIIKDLIEKPEKQGTTIGTAIVMRLLSGSLSVIIILILVSIINYGKTQTILVVFVYSINLIFHAFDTIDSWYQSNLNSKVSSIISICAFTVATIYRIFLLVSHSSVLWFASVQSLDVFLMAVMLLISYRKNNGQRLTFDSHLSVDILSRSYHFILSGIAIALYSQISTILLKHWHNEASVGYYGMATSLSAILSFAMVAVIDSARPMLFELHNKDRVLFKKRTIQLYSIIFYSTILVSLVSTCLAGPIVQLLYGSDYLPAVPSYRILTWYAAFSYLGGARSIWLVSEGKQKYEKLLVLLGATCSVVLNFALIPLMGVSGAALATLLTQILTSLIIPLLIPALRENSLLIIKALNPRCLKIW